MTLVTLRLIEQNLERVINFLLPYLRFVNCHMVNYFTDQHWEKFIDPELKKELEETDNFNELAINLMKNGYDTELNRKYPCLSKLLTTTRSHTLFEMPDLCLSMESFQNCELDQLQPDFTPLPIKEFMSAKKNHEVTLMSSIVSRLCKNHISSEDNNSILIIDAGDGKGYLSSRLALEYKLFVIGIDSSQINTNGANKRSEKLERAWNVLVDRAEKAQAGTLQKGRRKNKAARKVYNEEQQRIQTEKLYKTCTKLIEADTDFASLVQNYFPERKFDAYCLTGLHTCGNLAPNCLNIYKSNEKIQILCNIGCCYHLLTEEFVTNSYELNSNRFHQQRDLNFKVNELAGFPLSNFLKCKKFFLGRNARMLASQSVSRFFAEEKLPDKSLLFRAMLQVLIEQNLSNEDNDNLLVGKSKATTFLDYVQTSFEKFNTECPGAEKILEIEAEYNKKWDQMQLFYIIRMLFAPVIETLIMLDRVLFLKENGYEKSYIVQMFDPIISPRCFGVVSIK